METSIEIHLFMPVCGKITHKQYKGPHETLHLAPFFASLLKKNTLSVHTGHLSF